MLAGGEGKTTLGRTYKLTGCRDVRRAASGRFPRLGELGFSCTRGINEDMKV